MKEKLRPFIDFFVVIGVLLASLFALYFINMWIMY